MSFSPVHAHIERRSNTLQCLLQLQNDSDKFESDAPFLPTPVFPAPEAAKVVANQHKRLKSIASVTFQAWQTAEQLSEKSLHCYDYVFTNDMCVLHGKYGESAVSYISKVGAHRRKA